MIVLVLPTWRLLLFKIQIWLLMHGYDWLAIHLFAIVKFAFAILLMGTIVSIYVREVVWLWRVPARANKLAERGELEKAIALMRRSTQKFTPLLGTRPLYLKRMYRLGQMLENARRTGEANEVWEQILKRPALAHAFEVDVRKRLSNGLETLGDASGAQRQRGLCEDRLAQGEELDENHWSLLYERGIGAADARQFSKAQSYFERALDAPKIGVLHSKRKPIDVEIATRLALAAHQAGSGARAESAARFAVENANSPFRRSLGLHALALALGTQSRIAEALEVAHQGILETQKLDNSELLAESYGQYAMYLEQSGQVRQALAQCEMATRIGAQTSRTVLLIAANCSQLLGDYAKAREWLGQAYRTIPATDPANERMMHAMLDLQGAQIEHVATYRDSQDRAQAAWDLIQRAKPGLVGFDRLLLWTSAAETIGLVLLGQKDKARLLRAQTESHLSFYEGDTETHITIWTSLARASLLLCDWSDAERLWRLYFDSGWGRPVYRIGALCGLGECLLAMGDKEGARNCWQEAIAPGFDIADTARAREFLASNC